MGNNERRKLTQANLETFAGRVSVPTYDRKQLAPAIVHLGVGGFHRSHQAVYLDELATHNITMDWGERGVGLLPSDQHMAAAVIPQDCLYTVVTRDANGEAARVIGSMTDYLFAPDNGRRVLDALADPATRIVSLTITEGGYNVDSHSGRFDADNPAIQDDLRNPDLPRSVFAYVCAGLERRRRAGDPPFTVLSCDNLQGNGAIARSAITSFARLRDDRLADWIEANVAFPNGMVDRITPQTTDADRALVTNLFGIVDAWPVMAEPFTQWVIEDTFANGRPPLEQVGAQIVTDVHPYETMKLRLLNASHQAMGYLGYLAGYRYIHEVMEDADFQTFIGRLMADEIAPLLPPVPGIDLPGYQRTLLQRFTNPKIADQVSRICTDGSDRMPKFLLPSLIEALDQGRPHRLLTLAVAGWIRYLRGVDQDGHPIAITDRLVSELRERANVGGADPRPILGLRSVFGDLGDRETFVSELAATLGELDGRGAKDAVSTYLNNPAS